MNTEIYQKRRDALRKSLSKENLDAILVSYASNRFYLSGFELHDGQCNESSGHLLITQTGQDYLFTDSRFYEVACTLWEKNRIVIYKSAVEDMRLFLKDTMGSKKIGIESKTVSHSFYEEISQGLNLESADGLIEDLRIIKDASEISLIEKSTALNHAMFQWLPTILKVGTSEAQIAYGIEKYFREHGATQCSFPSIVAKNTHAARPHHEPQESALLTENCHILIDAGARLNNYCSDQTRTFWVGANTETRFQNMLEQVQEAQKAAINLLRPGLTCREAHLAAVKSFEKHGVESAFTHSLGHGIGIDVHEEPRLSMRSERVLKAGMVVTVEPGLYYGDYGGVRWEHMVLITEDGHKVL